MVVALRSDYVFPRPDIILARNTTLILCSRRSSSSSRDEKLIFQNTQQQQFVFVPELEFSLYLAPARDANTKYLQRVTFLMVMFYIARVSDALDPNIVFLQRILPPPGATDHRGFLRFRCFQQPQSPVQRRVLLPDYENSHHARRGWAPAGLFQGINACRRQAMTPTRVERGVAATPD